MKLVCYFLLGVFLGVPWTFGQRAPTRATDLMGVRGFSHERPLPDLHVLVGGEPKAFPLQPYEPGQSLELPAVGDPLVFVRPPETWTTPDGAVGDPLLAPLSEWRRQASAVLPSGSRQVMLAFVPNAPRADTPTDPFRVIIIDDDPRAYPAGSMRLINFSPHPLAYQLGEERGTITPGGQKIHVPKLDRKHRTYLRMATQSTGEWQIFHQGVASVLPERRSTYLVVFSVSRQFAEGMDVARGRDGRPIPVMIAIPWSDTPVSDD